MRATAIDRRSWLASMTAAGLSISLASRAPAAESGEVRSPVPSMKDGRLVDVGDTRIWVDDSGPRDAPALLYVHGGPGVGALEFEAYMKPALAGRVRLISVDQRGALRSDPLAAGTKVSAGQVVDDFEAVRRELGIARWQVLGHSFGGHFAMRYALQYPDRVTRLSLENPAYDVASSSHWLCASGAQALIGIDPDAAKEANRLACAMPIDAAFVESMGKTLAVLGEHRQDLYVVQERNRDMFSRLEAVAGLPEARWAQGQVPGMALLTDPQFLEPMLDRVKDVQVPMLLVRGSGDHAISPAEIVALTEAGAKYVTVPNAGHFIHVEEPFALADILLV